MKRTFLLLIALMFTSTMVFAMPKVVEKAKDGVMTVVKSPLHVHDSLMSETKSAKFMPFGLVGGLLKGTADMGIDIIKGTYTVLRAPIDS